MESITNGRTTFFTALVQEKMLRTNIARRGCDMESIRYKSEDFGTNKQAETPSRADAARVTGSVELKISLPLLIAKDLVTRHLAALAAVVATVITACVIVYITFLVREATAELQVLESKQHHLQTEWRKLRLEQSTLAEHSRIESIAKKELGMRYLTVSEERVIRQ